MTLNAPAERLAVVVAFAERYALEQAIIYAYGLPSGGRAERHQLLVQDIRSVVGPGLIGSAIGKPDE